MKNAVYEGLSLCHLKKCANSRDERHVRWTGIPCRMYPCLHPSFLSPPVSVMPFQEVWERSFCRTIEKLVEVVQEYPGEVEHIFSPTCVPLVRCAGCCGDENLECYPTHTSNVTMQVRHQQTPFSSSRRRGKGRGRKRKEKQKMKGCDQ
uniref:Placental growth factor b n=1 Tax=Scleropages formosus TaxID=113540 RepID=A0A8C9S204_SCLFO